MEKAFCFHWSNSTLSDLLVRLKKKKNKQPHRKFQMCTKIDRNESSCYHHLAKN